MDITGKLLPFLLGLDLDSLDLNFCLDSSYLLFESLLAIKPLLGFGGMAGLWLLSLVFVIFSMVGMVLESSSGDNKYF